MRRDKNPKFIWHDIVVTFDGTELSGCYRAYEDRIDVAAHLGNRAGTLDNEEPEVAAKRLLRELYDAEATQKESES